MSNITVLDDAYGLESKTGSAEVEGFEQTRIDGLAGINGAVCSALMLIPA